MNYEHFAEIMSVLIPSEKFIRVKDDYYVAYVNFVYEHHNKSELTHSLSDSFTNEKYGKVISPYFQDIQGDIRLAFNFSSYNIEYNTKVEEWIININAVIVGTLHQEYMSFIYKDFPISEEQINTNAIELKRFLLSLYGLVVNSNNK